MTSQVRVPEAQAVPSAPSRWRGIVTDARRSAPADFVDRYALAVAFFLLYATYSLLRHRALDTSGWDLGIFDQAVRNYAHFHAPVSDIKGVGYNLEGDHFHPILMLLVPLYWIVPSAETLLVAQAALIAVSILPIHRLARKLVGRTGAIAVAAAYGLSFGLQAALSFDFHEVAFAAPLLAFGLVALVEQRWRACALWLLPLLLVKEDFGLYLVAIGLVLAIRGQRRLGVWLAVSGLAGFIILVFFVIPALNPSHTNIYLGYYTSGQTQDAEYLVSGPTGHSDLWHTLIHAPLHLVDSSAKIKTIAFVCVVTGFIALRSPFMLIALVNLGIRFEAANPSFWTSSTWQYGLALMPIVFVAYLDALPRLREWVRGRAGRSADKQRITGLLPVYLRWSPIVVLAVAVVLGSRLPLVRYYAHLGSDVRLTARERVAYEMMSRIPNGVRVEAANSVAPHLTDRDDVVMWPFTKTDTDWVLADSSDPTYTSRGENQHVADLRRRGYVLVEQRDGFILMRSPKQGASRG